ncbi:hypothetical protein, conserved [Plasmodium gonderi]|uniref:Uncharacterized protein n=1 Tax=Plasmodium gonderi TaxID=77519 RepID=A0A1Y1JP04_PLAGO|nr:hypothetical protein, conserved [Plasmodium gonderi]GAW82582.1 hypothetical protein, conserved [Plasmodium gonderi]
MSSGWNFKFNRKYGQRKKGEALNHINIFNNVDIQNFIEKNGKLRDGLNCGPAGRKALIRWIEYNYELKNEDENGYPLVSACKVWQRRQTFQDITLSGLVDFLKFLNIPKHITYRTLFDNYLFPKFVNKLNSIEKSQKCLIKLAKKMISMFEVREMQSLFSILLEKINVIPIGILKTLVDETPSAKYFYEITSIKVKRKIWALCPYKFYEEIEPIIEEIVLRMKINSRHDYTSTELINELIELIGEQEEKTFLYNLCVHIIRLKWVQVIINEKENFSSDFMEGNNNVTTCGDKEEVIKTYDKKPESKACSNNVLYERKEFDEDKQFKNEYNNLEDNFCYMNLNPTPCPNSFVINFGEKLKKLQTSFSRIMNKEENVKEEEHSYIDRTKLYVINLTEYSHNNTSFHYLKKKKFIKVQNDVMNDVKRMDISCNNCTHKGKEFFRKNMDFGKHIFSEKHCYSCEESKNDRKRSLSKISQEEKDVVKRIKVHFNSSNENKNFSNRYPSNDGKLQKEGKNDTSKDVLLNEKHNVDAYTNSFNKGSIEKNLPTITKTDKNNNNDMRSDKDCNGRENSESINNGIQVEKEKIYSDKHKCKTSYNQNVSKRSVLPFDGMFYSHIRLLLCLQYKEKYNVKDDEMMKIDKYFSIIEFINSVIKDGILNFSDQMKTQEIIKKIKNNFKIKNIEDLCEYSLLFNNVLLKLCIIEGICFYFYKNNLDTLSHKNYMNFWTSLFYFGIYNNFFSLIKYAIDKMEHKDKKKKSVQHFHLRGKALPGEDAADDHSYGDFTGVIHQIRHDESSNLSEEGRSEEGRSEEGRSEESRSEESRSEESRSEEDLSEEGRSEEGRSEEGRSEEDLSEEDLSEEGRSEEDLSEESRSEEDGSEEGRSEEDLSEEDGSEEDGSEELNLIGPSELTNEKRTGCHILERCNRSFECENNSSTNGDERYDEMHEYQGHLERYDESNVSDGELSVERRREEQEMVYERYRRCEYREVQEEEEEEEEGEDEYDEDGESDEYYEDTESDEIDGECDKREEEKHIQRYSHSKRNENGRALDLSNCNDSAYIVDTRGRNEKNDFKKHLFRKGNKHTPKEEHTSSATHTMNDETINKEYKLFFNDCKDSYLKIPLINILKYIVIPKNEEHNFLSFFDFFEEDKNVENIKSKKEKNSILLLSALLNIPQIDYIKIKNFFIIIDEFFYMEKKNLQILYPTVATMNEEGSNILEIINETRGTEENKKTDVSSELISNANIYSNYGSNAENVENNVNITTNSISCYTKLDANKNDAAIEMNNKGLSFQNKNEYSTNHEKDIKMDKWNEEQASISIDMGSSNNMSRVLRGKNMFECIGKKLVNKVKDMNNTISLNQFLLKNNITFICAYQRDMSSLEAGSNSNMDTDNTSNNVEIVKEKNESDAMNTVIQVYDKNPDLVDQWRGTTCSIKFFCEISNEIVRKLNNNKCISTINKHLPYILKICSRTFHFLREKKLINIYVKYMYLYEYLYHMILNRLLHISTMKSLPFLQNIILKELHFYFEHFKKRRVKNLWKFYFYAHTLIDINKTNIINKLFHNNAIEYFVKLFYSLSFYNPVFSVLFLKLIETPLFYKNIEDKKAEILQNIWIGTRERFFANNSEYKKYTTEYKIWIDSYNKFLEK